jgi:hypothetical protein
MKVFIKIFLFLFLISLVSSCAKKNIEVLVPVIEYKIKDRALAKILDSLLSLKPKYFYTKIKIDYKDNATDVSFKTSLKIVSDSALNAIVTKIGIPIANGLITTDSAKILNIHQKCLINSSWDNFRDLLNIEIDYFNLENILLGRPLTDAFNQKYFVEKEEYEAMAESSKKVSDTTLSIATIPKSKLLLNYILQDNLKDLAETRIFSTDDSTDIRIQYLSREIVSGFNLPNKVLISLSKSKYNLVVKLEYDKTTVNEKIEIIFLIPEKYEVCN